MISERTKRILSEEISEDEERTVIFLEEGDESFAFRLFRATEGAGDPEQRAIRWLGFGTGPWPCAEAQPEN